MRMVLLCKSRARMSKFRNWIEELLRAYKKREEKNFIQDKLAYLNARAIFFFSTSFMCLYIQLFGILHCLLWWVLISYEQNDNAIITTKKKNSSCDNKIRNFNIDNLIFFIHLFYFQWKLFTTHKNTIKAWKNKIHSQKK